MTDLKPMFTGVRVGLIVVAAAVGLWLLMSLATGLGWRWDPFDLEARRLERAQVSAELSRQEAGARALELEGERSQAARIEDHHLTLREVEASTSVAQQEAQSAHDAQIPLGRDRADRLRDHDRGLCRQAAHLAGCASASGFAADGA